MPFLTGILVAIGVAVFARLSGFDRQKVFYPVVLVVVASYYLLFAAMAGGGGMVPELIGFAVFTIVAVIGFRTSLWIAAAGLAAHGLFDYFRHLVIPGRGVPHWWPDFCMGFDVAAGALLALMLIWATAKSRNGAISS